MKMNKNINKKLESSSLVILSVVLIFLLVLTSLVLLYTSKVKSNQSEPFIVPKVEFYGEYCIGDGEFKPLHKGEHISALKGNVTLRGRFNMVSSDGKAISEATQGTILTFYLNHINVIIKENGFEDYISDIENPLFADTMCGASWEEYTLMSDGKKPIEIELRNLHSFGNENAVDEFLSSLSVYGGIKFEKSVISAGSNERILGYILLTFSFILIGTSMFLMALNNKYSVLFLLLALSKFYFSWYLIFNSKGIEYLLESIIVNTTTLGICFMLCMFFFSTAVAVILGGRKNKIGLVASSISGFSCAVSFIVPMISEICYYDTWFYWNISQCIVCAVLFTGLVIGARHQKSWNKVLYISLSVLMISFIVDFIAMSFGFWQSYAITAVVCIIHLMGIVIVLWRMIPKSIKASLNAKELEAEKKALSAQLQEKRMAIMISQIQPHFIYNTLGSIEQLCEIDPTAATELVNNFSKYLRGNFSEIDSLQLIPLSEDIEHARYYTKIEMVRFPDIKVNFGKVDCSFLLPALTIQPLVENAIKHGIMGLTHGGEVNVYSYEAENEYVVSVDDNGVGFDVNKLLDEKKHIGIHNIQERLKLMCNGKLIVESIIGKGTKVTVKIPKGGNNESNCS